jgi:hypothetical protein
MTLLEIKAAIAEGKRVFHQSTNYEVIKDNIGQYLIMCRSNDYCIGLTWRDGETMNGKENEFFIEINR